MLLLGAQILQWYWLVVLGGIGTGIAGYRVYARRLPPYLTAQIIDSRLQLSDSLSTAWFLLSEMPRRQDAPARFQIMQAEQLAATVDASDIFQFRGGRAWGTAGALAAVAFGLFAIRYFVTNSLSIQQTIIPLQFGQTIERLESWFPVSERKNQPFGAEHKQRESNSQANKQRGVLNPERNIEPGRSDEAKLSSSPNGTKSSSESHNQPAGGEARGQDGLSPDAQRSMDPQPTQTATHERALQQVTNSDNEPDAKDQNSSGLVDKVREALSSFMTKLRPKEGDRNAERGDQGSSQDKKGDQVAAARDRNGNLQQSARNDQESQEQNAQGATRGRTAEKTQTSQNQSSDESSDRKSANSHSGIGHTNGDKKIKDAEQLKAMGKLAEIIGRRSANLTGDITVETSSTNQQLRTQYSGRVGEHADLGGEINHDEIPVMYREYVREYMQVVHKQADQQR
jgi:hypothetical protein